MHRQAAREFCDMFRHEWDEEYYGYKCRNCGMFIAYGCEPWAPDEDEDGEYEDVYADWARRGEGRLTC